MKFGSKAVCINGNSVMYQYATHGSVRKKIVLCNHSAIVTVIKAVVVVVTHDILLFCNVTISRKKNVIVELLDTRQPNKLS
jgi:hypothetical protein